MADKSASSKPGILMLGKVLHAPKEFAALSEFAQVTSVTDGNREKFIQDCKNGTYDNVKAISRTVESASYTGLFDKELIDALPSSIKFICHNGAGYDQVDAVACSARGILLSNTPGAVDSATADIAMFLILGSLRRAWMALSAIRRVGFEESIPLGRDPEGKVLGILGMGGIGSAVARRAVGFGLKVQYHNRNPVKKLPAGVEATYVSFEELLKTSDIISLHLPLGPSTRHTIGKGQLAMMKPGMTIINTARGAIIDEQALVDALADGDRIWSVGLDVFEGEPKIHPDLIKNDKVMLLPHIGTATVETRKKMEVLVIDNVTSGVKDAKLLTPVNA